MEQVSILKARQIRAARALLDWSQENLASATALSIATIRKIELGHISPRGKTMNAIRHAFEGAGLEFLLPDGVRHRPEEIMVYQGREGGRAFYDDVYQTAKNKGGDLVVVNPSSRLYFQQMLGDYHSVHIERMTAIKHKSSVKVLLTEDKDELPGTSYVEFRWISKHYVDSVPFYVYGDKFAVILIQPEIRITVIQSHPIAEAYRRQFYSMWDKATPLNK